MSSEYYFYDSSPWSHTMKMRQGSGMVNVITKFQAGFPTSLEALLNLSSSTQGKRRLTCCDQRQVSTGLCGHSL